MTLLDRLSSLVQQTTDDLLKRNDDPEAALDRLLANLTTTLATLRDRRLELEGTCASLRRRADRAFAKATVWRGEAEEAGREKDETTARSALQHAKDETAKQQAFEKELSEYETTAVKLDEQIAAMQKRTQSAKNRRDLLVARLRTAKIRKHNEELCGAVAACAARSSESDLDLAFDELEHKLATIEALEGLELGATEVADEVVEDELAALRKKVAAKRPRARKGK